MVLTFLVRQSTFSEYPENFRTKFLFFQNFLQNPAQSQTCFFRLHGLMIFISEITLLSTFHINDSHLISICWNWCLSTTFSSFSKAWFGIFILWFSSPKEAQFCSSWKFLDSEYWFVWNEVSPFSKFQQYPHHNPKIFSIVDFSRSKSAKYYRKSAMPHFILSISLVEVE